jgi:hypothetical protein
MFGLEAVRCGPSESKVVPGRARLPSGPSVSPPGRVASPRRPSFRHYRAANASAFHCVRLVKERADSSLDEPTSALDVETEQSSLRAIEHCLSD